MQSRTDKLSHWRRLSGSQPGWQEETLDKDDCHRLSHLSRPLSSAVHELCVAHVQSLNRHAVLQVLAAAASQIASHVQRLVLLQKQNQQKLTRLGLGG